MSANLTSYTVVAKTKPSVYSNGIIKQFDDEASAVKFAEGLRAADLSVYISCSGYVDGWPLVRAESVA